MASEHLCGAEGTLSLDLYDFGDGGAAATRWRRQHNSRRRRLLAKKHRAEARANKKAAATEARRDLKIRQAKWLTGWKRKCAAAKAAGLRKPSKKGRPWRLSLDNFQVKDMTGRVFGRLTVIRSAPISLTMRTSQRCRVWVTKCSCGSPEHLVNGTSLRQGNVRSCGCLRREILRSRKGEKRSHPLSVKMLIAAKELRQSGNIRVARMLELAAPAVRRRERRRRRGG